MCFTAISVASTFAQANGSDVITKTDGTLVEAKVVSISDKEVQYQKKGSDVMYVSELTSIHSIEYANGEKEIYNKITSRKGLTESILRKGYHGTAEIGGGAYMVGSFAWGGGYLNFQTIHGYQFNPYLFIGGGIGINMKITYNNWGTPGTYMPFFADIRGTLPVTNAALFLEVKLGGAPELAPSYALWGEDRDYQKAHYRGCYFSPSIGTISMINDKYSAGIAFEYALLQGQLYDRNRLWHHLGLKLIFGF